MKKSYIFVVGLFVYGGVVDASSAGVTAGGRVVDHSSGSASDSHRSSRSVSSVKRSGVDSLKSLSAHAVADQLLQPIDHENRQAYWNIVKGLDSTQFQEVKKAFAGMVYNKFQKFETMNLQQTFNGQKRAAERVIKLSESRLLIKFPGLLQIFDIQTGEIIKSFKADPQLYPNNDFSLIEKYSDNVFITNYASELWFIRAQDGTTIVRYLIPYDLNLGDYGSFLNVYQNLVSIAGWGQFKPLIKILNASSGKFIFHKDDRLAKAYRPFLKMGIVAEVLSDGRVTLYSIKYNKKIRTFKYHVPDGYVMSFANVFLTQDGKKMIFCITLHNKDRKGTEEEYKSAVCAITLSKGLATERVDLPQNLSFYGLLSRSVEVASDAFFVPVYNHSSEGLKIDIRKFSVNPLVLDDASYVVSDQQFINDSRLAFMNDRFLGVEGEKESEDFIIRNDQFDILKSYKNVTAVAPSVDGIALVENQGKLRFFDVNSLDWIKIMLDDVCMDGLQGHNLLASYPSLRKGMRLELQATQNLVTYKKSERKVYLWERGNGLKARLQEMQLTDLAMLYQYLHTLTDASALKFVLNLISPLEEARNEAMNVLERYQRFQFADSHDEDMGRVATEEFNDIGKRVRPVRHVEPGEGEDKDSRDVEVSSDDMSDRRRKKYPRG